MAKNGRPGKPMFIAQKFLNSPVIGNPNSFPELESPLASIGQTISPTILQAMQAAQLAAAMRARPPGGVVTVPMTILVQSEEDKKKQEEAKEVADAFKELGKTGLSSVADELKPGKLKTGLQTVLKAADAVEQGIKLSKFTKKDALEALERAIELQELVITTQGSVGTDQATVAIAKLMSTLNDKGISPVPKELGMVEGKIAIAAGDEFAQKSNERWNKASDEQREDFRKAVSRLREKLGELKEQ